MSHSPSPALCFRHPARYAAAFDLKPSGLMAPKASATGSRAAQPATSSSSAAQPASPPFREQPSPQYQNTHNVTLPAHETSFKTLKDLRQWLHHLPEPDQSSACVCRVRNALCVLELQSSRDTRKQIQALLKAWDIQQWKAGKKRSLLDVQQRLSSAVLAEGSRLRSLTRSAGSLNSHASFERMFLSGDASLALDTTARARSRSPQTNRRSHRWRRLIRAHPS